MPLAFLNLGTSEMVLILLLVLMLFGAEKAPQLARSLGKARSQMEQARSQLTEALKTEDERAWDQQLAFERERERQVAATLAQQEPERVALQRAAEELGLQTQGLTDDELRAAIRARLEGPAQGR